VTRRVLVDTGEKIPAYIGKCVICKATHRWDVPEALRTSNPHWLPEGRPWCLCRTGVACEDRFHGGMEDTLNGGGHDHPCTAVNFKPLNGTYVETKRCDAACENASSNKCACSCGGRNHGRGHVLDRAGVV
jgi:hypothetical protein